MTRINPNTSPDAKSLELLAGVKKMLGGTPNMFTTLAHSSSSLGFAVSGFSAFNESKLSASLREQIALTVAGVNSCDYCASAHTTLGKMNKISESELSQNLCALSADARTQSALTFAKTIVDSRGLVSDQDVTQIREAGFSEGEIVDIVAVVAFNIFTNYFNHVAGTSIDFPLVSTKNLAHAA